MNSHRHTAPRALHYKRQVLGHGLDRGQGFASAGQQRIGVCLGGDGEQAIDPWIGTGLWRLWVEVMIEGPIGGGSVF
jgi:hypothetical protein